MSFGIILHIVFGVIAFAGSLLTASSFIPKMKSLTLAQKAGLALSYVGIMGSTILGVSGSTSTVVLVAITAGVVAYTVYEFAKARTNKAEATNTNVAE